MIVCAGESLIDFIPIADSHGRAAYRPAPGGSPYNTAIAIARLGVEVGFLGKISRDFFGDQLFGNLAENLVNTHRILRSDKGTTLAFVTRTGSGEARYAFFAEDAADRSLSTDEIPVFGDDVAALQFGSISLLADPTSETLVSLAERESRRRVVSFDPNIRTSLISDESSYRTRVNRAVAAATIAKVSDEDLEWITADSNLESGARSLLERGPSLVVVTRGAEGALAVSRGATVEVEAVDTAVEDTIGAGDSFHAALLAWLSHADRLSAQAIGVLNADMLGAMLRFATAVAARTCARAGADPPQLDEMPVAVRDFHPEGRDR